ncbi:cytochrome c3 family protein [candidate division KSB1 bacterium]
MKKKSILIIIAGIFIIYGATVKVSESNMACGYCHTDQHLTWDKGTHKTVDCKGCHIDPGIGGAFNAQMGGVKNLLIAMTKGTEIQPHEEPLPISTENCMGCHAAILYFNELGFLDIPEYNTLQGQGLAIGHRIHVEKHTIACVECHRGIVHRDPDDIRKYETNWPFMHKDCVACHDSERMERFDMVVFGLEDKKECIRCHPVIVPPPDDEPIIKK